MEDEPRANPEEWTALNVCHAPGLDVFAFAFYSFLSHIFDLFLGLCYVVLIMMFCDDLEVLFCSLIPYTRTVPMPLVYEYDDYLPTR